MTNLKGTGTKTPEFTDVHAVKYLKIGFEALQKGNFKDASAAAKLILKYKPELAQPHFLVGLIAVQMEDWGTAQQAFGSVVELDKKHAAGWAQLARAQTRTGHYNSANEALAHAERYGSEDPLVQDLIGSAYEVIGDQNKALTWYERACAKNDSPAFEMNLGKGLIFHGRFKEARKYFNRVLEKRPFFTQAHWFLSRLEKARDETHIQEMLSVLEKLPKNTPQSAFLYYGLGKEYEDLKKWPEAFKAYESGGKIRRANITFDEEQEVEIFEALKQSFTKSWIKNVDSGYDDPAPIFIIGQPRTGTTLVERILTARDDVHSAGELQQFGLCVKRLSGVMEPGVMSVNLARNISSIDPNTIGQAYINATRSLRSDLPRFVDKLPVNYRYAPLIAAALPNAKIIHLTRNPMDSCFSSFKQLFAEAYYHSYDQGEMARHHLRYRDLMDHYRVVLGDRMIDVAYEDVVADMETQARRLVDYLDLNWQDASLEFHKQKTAVTTASASQVREKIYSGSVGRWRKYDNELTVMKSIIGERLSMV